MDYNALIVRPLKYQFLLNMGFVFGNVCNEMPIQQKHWFYIGNVSNEMTKYFFFIVGVTFHSNNYGIVIMVLYCYYDILHFVKCLIKGREVQSPGHKCGTKCFNWWLGSINIKSSKKQKFKNLDSQELCMSKCLSFIQRRMS